MFPVVPSSVILRSRKEKLPVWTLRLRAYTLFLLLPSLFPKCEESMGLIEGIPSSRSCVGTRTLTKWLLLTGGPAWVSSLILPRVNWVAPVKISKLCGHQWKRRELKHVGGVPYCVYVPYSVDQSPG